MKLTNRWLLWLVFVVQLIGFIGVIVAVAWPLAQRSAADLAGLMLISAKTYEELPEGRRAAFAQSLFQDTGVIIESGVLPDIKQPLRPHWYADWVSEALRLQNETPFQVVMQKGQIQVSMVVDSTPVVIRADSPRLGVMLVVFFAISLLAMLGTLLALWWQSRWQKQMLRTQVMLSGLSHDLRTPLTRLRLSIALLPSISESEQAQLSEQIQSLNGLVDTALALSKSPDTKHKYKQTALSQLWLSWQKNYPEVIFDMPHSDKCSEKQASILLSRIVQNLIDNALVHGQGQVSVFLLCQQNAWQLQIIDEGAGIPDKVWRSIQQQQQPEAKGVGIGLLTSYWLAQIMGVVLSRIEHGVLITATAHE
jgi:two-component system osmolarity sensor histidine kinase EnvZ